MGIANKSIRRRFPPMSGDHLSPFARSFLWMNPYLQDTEFMSVCVFSSAFAVLLLILCLLPSDAEPTACSRQFTTPRTADSVPHKHVVSFPLKPTRKSYDICVVAVSLTLLAAIGTASFLVSIDIVPVDTLESGVMTSLRAMGKTCQDALTLWISANETTRMLSVVMAGGLTLFLAYRLVPDDI